MCVCVCIYFQLSLSVDVHVLAVCLSVYYYGHLFNVYVHVHVGSSFPFVVGFVIILSKLYLCLSPSLPPCLFLSSSLPPSISLSLFLHPSLSLPLSLSLNPSPLPPFLSSQHESVKSVKDALELLATKEPVDLPEKDGVRHKDMSRHLVSSSYQATRTCTCNKLVTSDI